jgi:hypothetical protein
MIEKKQVFISYSSHDEFEASLLKFAAESILANKNVIAWMYQRDQNRTSKDVANSLKEHVKSSIATLFLVSPNTLDSGATQWMELAYSDAFNIKTYILLHHLTYQQLKNREKGVPPLLLSSQCNPDSYWLEVINEIGNLLP